MFDDFVARAGGAHAYVAAADKSYWLTHTAFGGWTAAGALTAAQAALAENEPSSTASLLSLNIEFFRGVDEGSVQFDVQLLHATRSTGFYSVDVSQPERSGLAARASVVFSRRRDTDALCNLVMPVVPMPEAIKPWVFDSPSATWPLRYDMRPASGRLFVASEHMRTLFWQRPSSGAAWNMAQLVALADAHFPRMFFHYPAPSLMATITMSVHVHVDTTELAGLGADFLLCEVFSQVARGGFFDQQVRVWSRVGRLVLTSTQLVWFNVKSSTDVVQPQSNIS
jgi:acyl-CoA thioesterase